MKCSNCQSETFTCSGCGVVIESWESAVPQPVDREALAKIDNALRNGSRMTAANVGFEKLCRQLGVNRDSLAVLAGEQEQVEP